MLLCSLCVDVSDAAVIKLTSTEKPDQQLTAYVYKPQKSEPSQHLLSIMNAYTMRLKPGKYHILVYTEGEPHPVEYKFEEQHNEDCVNCEFPEGKNLRSGDYPWPPTVSIQAWKGRNEADAHSPA
jgi:hypothetical protein